MKKLIFLQLACFLTAFVLLSCSGERKSTEDTEQEGKVMYEETEMNKPVFETEPIIEMDTTEGKTLVPVNKKKVVTKDECTEAYVKLEKLVIAYKASKSQDDLNRIVEFRKEASTVKCSENPAYVKKFRALLEG